MSRPVLITCGEVGGRAVSRRQSSSVVVVEPGEPGGQPFDRYLELRVEVDERPQLLGEPVERDLLLAAPTGQLLDAAVGEVQGGQRSNAAATRFSCSTSCFLCEPVAGEADAIRDTSRSGRVSPYSSIASGRLSAM